MLKLFKCVYFNFGLIGKLQVVNLSNSSKIWLKRQNKDPFVIKAKHENYRCRSAFKLVEIIEKYKIIREGDFVIDCGGSPGSWAQVAAQYSHSTDNEKRVISFDINYIKPITGVCIFSSTDITNKTQMEPILKMSINKANCIISDMAPKISGIYDIDSQQHYILLKNLINIAPQLARKNSSFLCKIFSPSEKLKNLLLQLYTQVKYIKPKASRSESSELYILATKFKF